MTGASGAEAAGAGEFGFIARHFRPLAGAESLDLRDDCALMRCPEGEEFAISTDTMVENVHFLPDDLRKPSAVSCCAATCPIWRPWAHAPCLYAERDRYAWRTARRKLVCRILTRTGGRPATLWCASDRWRYHVHFRPLVLSATVFGLLRHNTALRRSTARPGMRSGSQARLATLLWDCLSCRAACKIRRAFWQNDIICPVPGQDFTCTASSALRWIFQTG